MRPRSLPIAFAAASFLALLGCREEKIASYRVRKEAPPKIVLPPTNNAAGSSTPRWNVPSNWSEQPPGNVRIASFAVTAKEGSAEVSVTQFPGEVGGDLANVNRWRGQLQLPPIAEAELGKFVKLYDLPAGQFSYAEFAAEKAVDGKIHNRIIGAWLKQPERTWFFKVSGDGDAVAGQRETFINFLKSVEFAATSPEALDTSAGGPITDQGTTAAIASTARALSWVTPTDWVSKPLGQMRKGSYTLRGPGGDEADFSIIAFPGDAGGIAENLNRWRGQIHLPPLEAKDLASASTTVAVGGLRFTVVDYVGTGTAGSVHIIGAILPLETETYFFKMMGPDDVVSQNKAAFQDFLKTVKAH